MDNNPKGSLFVGEGVVVQGQAEVVRPVLDQRTPNRHPEDAEDAGHAVRIVGSARQPVRFRPLALKRCLTNLVDNALKYGQWVEITIADGPGRLTLTLRDHGPGIPTTELEKVFDPFYRLEGSRSRDTGGSGLGLSIARTIARAHGGELTLRNHPEGGLEAVLELPR